MPLIPARSRFPLALAVLPCLALPVRAKSLYAAPAGRADAVGTAAAPMTLRAGMEALAAGDTLFLQSGTYADTAQLTVATEHSGSSGKEICLFAAAGAKPVLDFSAQPYGKDSNPRGLELDGSYWHLRGLEVKGSADNGIYVAGKHNVVENCVTHGNRDTGLQIGRRANAEQADWPSDNLILNCESYDNYDMPPGAGENADGFACKLTAGSGNVFRGCVSHNNIDDGWDLYTKTDTGPIGPVTLDQCVSYGNGTLSDGTSNANGDRNGFKLGGSDIAVAHLVTRCVAIGNGKNGFTWNSNPGATHLINCLAIDNSEGNFNFGNSSTPTEAVFANNLSFWSKSPAASDKTLGTDYQGSNCWWDKSKGSIGAKSLTVTAADFAVPPASMKVARSAATGAPDLSVFRLAAGSKLRNAGVTPPAPLPYEAAAYYAGVPDLGAVEGEGVSAARNDAAGPRRVRMAGPIADGAWSIGSAEGFRDARGRIRPHGPAKAR